MAKRKGDQGDNVIPLFDELRAEVLGPDHKRNIRATADALIHKGFHAIEHALTEQEREIASSADQALSRSPREEENLKLYAFSHSAFCVTSLLHDRHPNDPGKSPDELLAMKKAAAGKVISGPSLFDGTDTVAHPVQRRDGDITHTAKAGRYQLFMQPLINPANKEYHGLPYGIYGRLVMLYLQSEACRTGGDVINVGRSLSGFCEMIGLETNNEKIRLQVADQINRLATTSFSLTMPRERKGGGAEVIETRLNIIDGQSWVRIEDLTKRWWIKEVKLNTDFVNALVQHAVPLDAQIIQNLKRSTLLLDIYLWLCYRLPGLTDQETLSWSLVMEQFGIQNTKQKRHEFREYLRDALLAYPNARVDVTERGLLIAPSDPPTNAARVRGRIQLVRRTSPQNHRQERPAQTSLPLDGTAKQVG